MAGVLLIVKKKVFIIYLILLYCAIIYNIIMAIWSSSYMTYMILQVTLMS
jgi:hypothetical protein